MSATDPNTVREWLKALGVLCAGNLSQEEAELKLSAYAPLLAREFGPECFTPGSLTSVARATKFFPSFGEVCNALTAWWQENSAARMVRLSGPERLAMAGIPERPGEPSPDALQAVKSVVRAFVAERTFNQPSGTNGKPPVEARTLSDGRLLAEYERLAREGDNRASLRAQMIRKRLAQRPLEVVK